MLKHDTNPASQTEAKPERFVWPPRGGGAMSAITERLRKPVRVELPRVEQPRGIWSDIERTWLEVETPPLHERLAEAGARVDEPFAYCHRCGHAVGRHEADESGCATCRGTKPPWSAVVRLARYAPPWSGIVQDVKFSKWRSLGVALGRMLGTAVREHLGEHDDATLVVPVPTGFIRRMTRGIDHPLVLARGVARELHAPIWRPIARADRVAQTSLSATDRATNLRRAMFRHPRSYLPTLRPSLKQTLRGATDNGVTLVLVDDVMTTGATLREAARAAKGVCRAMGVERVRLLAAVACVTETDRRREGIEAALGEAEA